MPDVMIRPILPQPFEVEKSGVFSPIKTVKWLFFWVEKMWKNSEVIPSLKLTASKIAPENDDLLAPKRENENVFLCHPFLCKVSGEAIYHGLIFWKEALQDLGGQDFKCWAWYDLVKYHHHHHHHHRHHDSVRVFLFVFFSFFLYSYDYCYCYRYCYFEY